MEKTERFVIALAALLPKSSVGRRNPRGQSRLRTSFGEQPSCSRSPLCWIILQTTVTVMLASAARTVPNVPRTRQ